MGGGSRFGERIGVKAESVRGGIVIYPWRRTRDPVQARSPDR